MIITLKWCRHPGVMKLIVLLVFAVFMLTSCSVRSYQIKRAEGLYKKGQALQTAGRTEDAISRFNDSMALSEKAGFRPGVANNLNEIAIIYTSRGEYGKARALFGKALKIYRKMNWKTEVSKSLNNIALTYLKELKFREAIEAYKDLLDWDLKTRNHLGRIISLNNMGLIYERYLNEAKNARKTFEVALKIARKLGKKKYIRMLQEKLGE